MDSSEPKTFFKNLKETMRKISKDVEDIKAMNGATPTDAARKFQHLEDRVDSLKEEATALKEEIAPKLAQMGNFINDYKELALDIEFLVSKQENYLMQYGYVPLSKDPVDCEKVPESKNEHLNDEKEEKKEEDTQLTPVLSDFGTSLPKNKEREEATNKTPVLRFRSQATNLPQNSTSKTKDLFNPTRLNPEDPLLENEATTPVTPDLNIQKPDEADDCSTRKKFFCTTPVL